MNNMSNLESYNDVENLKRFDEASFADYCSMKLKTADSNASFIKKYCFDGSIPDGIAVCEIGSGNSKLLYKLEQMYSGGGTRRI